MRSLFFLLLALFLFSSSALAVEGLVTVKSAHDVKITTDRLETALLKKGMKVFARIDHRAGATSVGLELRPTELLIFGNPKAGTPLMQCQQSLAIDLPQKALIWEDEAGVVWLAYNAPHYLAERHALEGCGEAALDKVAGALANFAMAATAP